MSLYIIYCLEPSIQPSGRVKYVKLNLKVISSIIEPFIDLAQTQDLVMCNMGGESQMDLLCCDLRVREWTWLWRCNPVTVVGLPEYTKALQTVMVYVNNFNPHSFFSRKGMDQYVENSSTRSINLSVPWNKDYRAPTFRFWGSLLNPRYYRYLSYCPWLYPKVQ